MTSDDPPCVEFTTAIFTVYVVRLAFRRSCFPPVDYYYHEHCFFSKSSLILTECVCVRVCVKSEPSTANENCAICQNN